MKRNYLLVLGLGMSVVSFAQQKTVEKKPAYEGLTVDVLSVKPHANLVSKVEGDVIYNEQFNGSAGSWTTSGTDGAFWLFDTNGPDGQYSSTTNADIITSTTAGNGFMIYDADLSNPAAPFVNRQGSLVSPVIDLTGVTNLSVRFQQAYRTCCSATFMPKLEVSTDGFTTMTTFDVTALGVGVNDFSGTVIQEVNLNTFLATATNLNNFQMRFNFDGVSGASSHYFWQLDDIELFEPYMFSLKAGISYWGTFGFWGPRLPYGKVPVNQIAPVDFSVVVENKGSATQTDAQFSTSIPEASFNDAGAVGTLPAFSSDTLDAAASFTPGTTPMVFNPTFMVSSGATDIDPSDNSLTGTPFEVTTDVYARDFGVVDGGSYNQGEGYEVGNIFDMFANDQTYGATFMPRSTSVAGASVYVRLYDLDPITRDFRFVTESDAYTLTAADLGQLVTLPFTDVIDLLKDSSYLLVVGSYGDGGTTDDLVTATSGSAEAQTCYYFDMTDQTWYYTTNTPIVRMMMGDGVGIVEKSAINTMNVYPNPAKESTVLTFNLKGEGKATIEITDVTGKVVAVKTVNGKAGANEVKLDTATLTSGMYTVSVNSNEETASKRLMINK